MLPRELRLFLADVIGEQDGEQVFWYVVAKTYKSAFDKFTKKANERFHTYLYYFNEIEDEDEIQNFLNSYPDVKAGIYPKSIYF